MALVLRDCLNGDYAHPVTITRKWECTLQMPAAELLKRHRQGISCAEKNDRSSAPRCYIYRSVDDRNDVSIYRDSIE